VGSRLGDLQVQPFDQLPPFLLSPETFEVFKWLNDVGMLTGGALDVTILPLVDAWGFGPSGPRNAVPTDEEIARLRNAVVSLMPLYP
jgi:thiamine biosynthesis lipoprotein ApbE